MSRVANTRTNEQHVEEAFGPLHQFPSSVELPMPSPLDQPTGSATRIILKYSSRHDKIHTLLMRHQDRNNQYRKRRVGRTTRIVPPRKCTTHKQEIGNK